MENIPVLKNKKLSTAVRKSPIWYYIKPKLLCACKIWKSQAKKEAPNTSRNVVSVEILTIFWMVKEANEADIQKTDTKHTLISEIRHREDFFLN